MRLEDVSRGELIADAENKKVYTIDMIGSEESDPRGFSRMFASLYCKTQKCISIIYLLEQRRLWQERFQKQSRKWLRI